MKIVFAAYSYQPQVRSPLEWVEKIQPMAGIMQALCKYAEVYYVGRIGYEGNYTHEGVNYIFPRTPKGKNFFPIRFHKIIAALRPDACIVPGFHFPVQLMQLKRTVGRNCIVIARHHADQPWHGIKRMIQRCADRYTDNYLFNSKGNAEEWLQAKIIRNPKKIIELPAGTTTMQRQDIVQSLAITGMNGSPNFLWVGRLDENKDPFTVLKAFEQLLDDKPSAKLYMVYQEDKLINEVRSVIETNDRLKSNVVLAGKIGYDQLPHWYSAAHYHISSSHREGGSYALLEAMACGAVPIVSNIPASVKAVGDVGYVFKPGDVNGLFSIMTRLELNEYSGRSKLVREYFQSEFSGEAIAKQLNEAIAKFR
ncbi:MAG TPA: glycosyltransferase family 4 protein [Chitinophagaceae bacterium]|jgi:glycosyltransferase involved in cell wall biosynthesis|nr:glycosyltransferase family 4 protein [Chitinophagaceae bacterium]